MEIYKLLITEALIKQIYELSCTPFSLPAFRKKLVTYDWYYQPVDYDELGINIEITQNFGFKIDALGQEVISAVLPFYYWEIYDTEAPVNLEEYNHKLKICHEEFESVKNLALELLPDPFLYCDDDYLGQKSVVWEGKHGFLILQQTSSDIFFGRREINFFLENYSKEELHSEEPLIDWLYNSNQHIHNKRLLLLSKLCS
ncbi:MAG: hypothetical protein QNJ32_19275 [Xenococcaceae cyanobacterium MO_167.B27]|nr:hypothetical protein [Xenococcaceae cyanobacterium MO_167.B27]